MNASIHWTPFPRNTLVTGMLGPAAVLAADQWSKHRIVEWFGQTGLQSYRVLDILDFTLSANHGVAMSQLVATSDQGRWLLVALTLAITACVFTLLLKTTVPAQRYAYGLILGGTLGNIIDRVRFGYVIDFIHFHVQDWSFYIFNPADTAITLGVIMLLI